MTRVENAKGIIKVCTQMDADVKETNDRIDHQSRKGKRLEEKVSALVNHIALLEEANVTKEERISFLEGQLDSVTNKVCHCEDRGFSSNMEIAEQEDDKGEEGLEYASEEEYHTPPVVSELRLIESPILMVETLGTRTPILSQYMLSTW